MNPSVETRRALRATIDAVLADGEWHSVHDAIEVSRLEDMPRDYTGPMDVPVTYLQRHDPELFRIERCAGGGRPTRSRRPSRSDGTGVSRDVQARGRLRVLSN